MCAVWKSWEQFVLDGVSLHKEGFPSMKQPNIVILYLLLLNLLSNMSSLLYIFDGIWLWFILLLLPKRDKTIK